MKDTLVSILFGLSVRVQKLAFLYLYVTGSLYGLAERLGASRSICDIEYTMEAYYRYYSYTKSLSSKLACFDPHIIDSVGLS